MVVVLAAGLVVWVGNVSESMLVELEVPMLVLLAEEVGGLRTRQQIQVFLAYKLGRARVAQWQFVPQEPQ